MWKVEMDKVFWTQTHHVNVNLIVCHVHDM